MSVSPTNGIGSTKGQRKTLIMVGIEPMTFGLDHRCSTDGATRSDGSSSWEMKMSIARQLIISSTGSVTFITNVGCVALIFRTK